MKQFLCLFFILGFFSAAAQKNTVPKSCYQNKNHSYKSIKSTLDTRSDSIDILHTSLSMDMTDWTGRSLTAKADIEIQAKVANITTLNIDLLKLNIDSVKQGGDVLNYSYNDSLLEIDLISSLSINQTTSVQIFYSGVPYQNPADWGGFYWNNTYAFNVGVSFLEDPHNYGRAWFPCFDNFVERSTFEYFITTQASRKAFCNGLLTNEIANLDGTKTWHWEMNQEIPSYLASMSVAAYATINSDYNGLGGTIIPIQLAALPNDTANMKASFIHLPEAMQCYEENYAPYRFDRIGYCLTSFSSGAMEHATNITYMRSAVDGTTNSETLMAHELSHHWWGNYVTCSTAEDMWINEGWASYSEALFTEYVYGSEAYKDYSRSNHDRVLRLTPINDGDYYPVSGVPTELTYSSTVYDKGADMAHTIRGILGDAIFNSCIDDFLTTYAFQEVNTDQMQSFLSSCSGKDLSSFFSTWIKEKGSHHYSLGGVQVLQDNTTYTVQGTLLQKLWISTVYTEYLPIELTFFGSNKEKETRIISTYGPCSDFQEELSFEPIYIAVDLEEKIQDATVDHYKTIGQVGTIDFDLGRVNLEVTNISDSAFVHVTHHYISPDAFQSLVPNLHLSPNRYWSVGGVWDADFSANAIFRYNGTTSQSNGYLDNDLMTNSEDSLVLLFKANYTDDWSVVDSFTLNTQGNVNNKVGFFEVYKLKAGDYALAIYDKNRSTETTSFSPCLFTGIDNVERLDKLVKVYPNPTNDFIKVELLDDLDKNFLLKVVNILGAEVYNARLKKEINQIEISTKNWKKGTYILSFSNGQKIVLSKKVIVN